MATQPSLRIGDADRESVAAELREHFAHGRLTLDEFSQRLDAVFDAKTQRDLPPHRRPAPRAVRRRAAAQRADASGRC